MTPTTCFLFSGATVVHACSHQLAKSSQPCSQIAASPRRASIHCSSGSSECFETEGELCRVESTPLADASFEAESLDGRMISLKRRSLAPGHLHSLLEDRSAV